MLRSSSDELLRSEAMRSGVIAQKLGMTRIYTEDGEHVPVTVLKVDNCQVVAHKTAEKHGYTALQLGSARPRSSGSPRPSAAISRSPRSSRSGRFRNSASARRTDSGRRRDHRRPFRPGPVCRCDRHQHGQGISGAMKRWNFGGLRATHGVSVSHRSARLDRQPPGSGADLQEQEDAGSSRRRAGDDAEYRGGRRSIRIAA